MPSAPAPQILIVAEGKLPSPGFEVDIAEDPRRIFPQQFDLVRRPLDGFFPQVVTPYTYSESVLFPADQAVVTVHHAEGSDEVRIQKCGRELAAYKRAVADKGDEATGFSKNLSFDEAFANAVAALPPSTTPIADGIETIVVQEIGGLFGGFFPRRDLFVRVRRTAVI
ncbi:hypothetical protein [Symbioplanes lichenis]|uniref:hypothetical protein n=1 Tax=Symbioplanes lichenis TaxID=1629072 RepID=UPI002738BF31|nr:hypothetical protein [Actinoplanes lichenis]